jgi:choline dehydrogenase-like flavoprotein
MPSKGNPFPTQYMYGLTSVPQKNLSGRTGDVPAANIVGGGSAINAMFFDRGAKADYDAWAQLGNKGWDWNGLLPYFKKVRNFL